MRIVDLYKMSEEERKKALEEQQSLYNERMRQSEEIGRQANQQFNDLISKQGEYDTTRHTTTIGNLRNAYKNSSNYNKLNDSLNRIYLNSENSIWNKMQNIMTFNKTNNQRNNNIVIKNNGIDNWTTANNMAKQNNDKLNMIATTQTAKRLYEEKQKEAIKNTVEYNFIKSKNPNMSEEELIEKTKLETENKNKQFNETFTNMSKEERQKEIYKIQNMLNDKEGLFETDNKKIQNKQFINNLRTKSEAIEAEKEAERVNKILNEGNFLERATTATGELAGSMGKSAIDMTMSPIITAGSLAEGILPTNNFKGTRFDDIVDYKKMKDYGESVKTANIENDVLKAGKGVSSTIGGMIPSIIANITMPGSNIGMITQALGVGGEDYIENLNENKTNKLQSALSGTLKGLGSYATEKITGGNILGKGSLDDWATRTIANGTSKIENETLKKITQKIASKIYEVGGENFEELLENQIDHLVDTTVNNKGITFKEWLDEQSETVKQTTLTQLFLNLMGVGGDTYNEVQKYSQNAEMKQWINEAQKIIDKENLNIDNYKINNNNINEVRKTLNELPIENATANLQQQSTQSEQILPTQQINQEQNKVAQNGKVNEFNGYTDKEINNIESNKITVAKSNEDIINFVNSSKKVPSNRKMYLGKIKENISNYINEKFGINIGNYNISLKTDAIRHTENNHTNLEKETSRGQIPLVAEDYANIPVIINNPDNVSIDGKTQQGKPVIKFEKNIDGNNVVVTYVSDKHNNLELQTMYKFKNNKKMNPATASNELNSLNRTSETNSGTDSFINNSIPPIGNKVNSDTITNNYAQSNENNTQNEEYQTTKGETINWNEIERPEGKIRKHYRSIIESSNTTKEAKAIAKELMGTDTYMPDSNKKQLERANVRIENSTPDSELDSLMSRAKSGEKIDATDIAVGERLIQYYSKVGDKVKLRDSIQATAMAGTTAGQTVQAMALLNHQTPEGQVVWIQRSIEKLNNKMKNKKGDKAQQFEFTPEMQEKILNSKNKTELEQNLDEVYRELGQQVHKSFGQQIDSWRYFAMLGNPRTHIRNIVGNFLMGKAQGIKNKVAGTIEGTVAKFNPNMERTHTIVPASKEVLEFAKNDIENVASELELNQNKYHPQSRIESNMRTFKSNAMENTLGRIFDINDTALEAEDGWGLKAGYKKALAEYMTANKLTPENITDTQLAKGRKYAIQQAKEATFHQANAVASAVNSFINKNKATKAVGDALIPFVKTPANVAKAGVEYSPVGLTKSLIYDSIQLRKGNITANQYIDNISKGLTGSAITVLGYALAQAGILKASGSDDDKKEKFDQQSGKQAYSMQIGDNTYTIDWLAPVGIPLMVGAEIYEGLSQKVKEKNSKSTDDNEITKQFLDRAEVLANSLSSTLDPMVEMSMISSLTSAIKSFAQNDTEALANMMTNGAKSYLNQFVPTLLGQVAKTTDTVERDTTSTATGTISKAIDSTANQIKSKIPGLRQMLPTRKDIWGNDVKLADNWAQRFFETGILPASKKQINNDKVVKILNDLYDKNGDSKILPSTIEKSYTIDGQKYTMTNSEYNKYKTDYGKTSYNLIKELINSSDFKNLSNEQKGKAIENVYSYAKESNKLDYAKNNNLEVDKSTLYNTMQELKDKGGNQSLYLNYTARTTGIEKERDKNKVLASANYDDKTKSIIYLNGTGKDDKLYNNIKNSNININQYLTYKIEESEDKFLADKDSNGKSISGTAKKKVYDYVNSNITGYNNKLLLLGQKYKLTKSEQENLAKYINQISNNSSERNSLFEYYSKNFTIKDGKVYYK